MIWHQLLHQCWRRNQRNTKTLTLGGTSSSCLSQELRSNFSSRLVMRGGGMGVSEVGSEFCRGIGGRWGDRLSWKAETPWEDWSCRDCEPVIEEPWDFTETKWATWRPQSQHQTCADNHYTTATRRCAFWLIRGCWLVLSNSSFDSSAGLY